jgi:hypothetical protein
MYERTPFVAASSGDVSSASAIGRPGELRLAFGAIDGRVGCEIYHQIGPLLCDQSSDDVRPRDVATFSIEGSQVDGGWPGGA